LIVYGLVGKSGSGKSHMAQYVSKDYGIEYIIDDGLLINGNRVVAGTSAKKEETRVGAIRRALFSDAYHRNEVSHAIRELNPPSILIIGTSDGMVDKIAESLLLPPIENRLYIEDISSQREIEIAIKTRKEQGKHVIPVPTFAIKKDFSGYFIDSIKSLAKKDKNTVPDDIEKTVVRPTFSYLGKYTIANSVIKSMVSYAGEKVDGVYKISKINIENNDRGLKIEMDVSIDFGYIINEVSGRLKEYIKQEIEHMTAFNILEINVYVKTLNLNKLK